MKLTKRQLKSIIQEVLETDGMSIDLPPMEIDYDMPIDDVDLGTDATDSLPGRDLAYGEGEGRMVKSHLHKISGYADELYEMLRDSDDLPEWVSSKIAVMDHEIGRVKQYIEYKLHRMK